jgi:hypothetical protein
MKQAFDELAENLAGGMSRRKALQRFAAGVGAALAALFTGRSAAAQGKSVCREFCSSLGLSGPALAACVALSAHCPPGECAFTLQGNLQCVPVAED